MDVIWPPDTEEERELKRLLAEIQRQYEEAARPYRERLVALHALKVPTYLVTVGELEVARTTGVLTQC